MNELVEVLKDFVNEFERLSDAMEDIASTFNAAQTSKGIGVDVLIDTANDQFGGFDLHSMKIKEGLSDIAVAINSMEDKQ